MAARLKRFSSSQLYPSRQVNGHLTKQDRRTIHRQQNQESRRIYRDKRDSKAR